jgi:hypothetical protein
MSIERTQDLTKKAIGKCTNNADRLSNAVKALIDKIMRGDIFENASALGILQWLLCSDELKGLVSQIPPWWYDGTSTTNPNNPQEEVTPEQQYFYGRLAGLGADGSDLLTRLRTLQFGPEAALGTSPTLTDNLTTQQGSITQFKNHTDQQSGVGDPNTFMRTMGTASAYDSAKQQMEGKDQDNFTGFFNSTIQGPVIIDQMKKLLCEPDSIGRILRDLLSLIASLLPLNLDALNGILGGRSLDDFFNKLNEMFGVLASFFEYLNYLVSLDLSRFNLAQAYISKFTLGQFLAAIARGDGRGNCIMRAMMEEFTGGESLRESISQIRLEKDKEDKKQAAAAAATEDTAAQARAGVNETGKDKRIKRAKQEEVDKEVFYEPVSDELVLEGVITGEAPPVDSQTAALIQERLALLESRTYYLGYRIAVLPTPTPGPGSTPITGGVDGGYFSEDSLGGPDGVIPSDSEWYNPLDEGDTPEVSV